MSRRAGTAGRSGSNRRHRSVHTPGPMALVWITVARGVMAIVLGLALALHHDRAPTALVNFMGFYSLLAILGVVIALTGIAQIGLGTTVLVSDAVLMRRRLLAHPDDPAGSSSEVAS